MKSLTTLVLGNPVWAWMAAALVAAVAVSAAAIVKRLLRGRLERSPDGLSMGRRAILELAGRTSLLLVFGISLWAAGLLLTLPDKWERILRSAAILSLAVQGALWAHALIGLAADEGEVRIARRDPGSTTTVRTPEGRPRWTRASTLACSPVCPAYWS